MINRVKIPATHKYHRPILSDVLPFEVPPTFGNAGFFDFLTRYNVMLENAGSDRYVVWEASSSVVDEAISVIFNTEEKGPGSPSQSVIRRDGKQIHQRKWKLCKDAMRTKPYGFDISHKEREFRRLSVVHPRNQLAVADFYNRNSAQIIYYTGLSEVSIRYPAAVAKSLRYSDRLFRERKSTVSDTIEEEAKEYENLASFFSYRHFSNIFKFYEHYKYHTAEKKYDWLLRLDISKCFDSIYTHSLPWSTLGILSTKDHLSKSKGTFGGRFDRLLQEMNQGETNGIVIGPEFSRIFAEIILQRVDRSFLSAMFQRHGLKHRIDFQAYRYVDDYFIFCTSGIDRDIVEKEIGLALKDMKLSINTAKTDVINKPIITDLTIAKNKLRDVLTDCIQVRDTDIEHPVGSGTVVKSYSFKVLSNNLIVGVKSVLAETGVEYKNILNYVFAALEKKLALVFAKFRDMDPDIRNERRLVSAVMRIMEFSFFAYAADPRVNISIRLARMISLCVDELNNAKIGRDQKQQIYKYVFDNLTRQIKKSSLKRSPNIEVMYLILALRKLGRPYLVSEDILASYIGIKRDSETGKFRGADELDLFAVTITISYMTLKKRYKALRTAIEEGCVANFSRRSAYVHRDAELAMMYLDLISCPYVSMNTKMKLANFYGHSVFQVYALIGASPFWFTNWRGFDLSLALDKKRAREVY